MSIQSLRFVNLQRKMATSTNPYQVTENPSVYQVVDEPTLIIHNGRYDNIRYNPQWGYLLKVPRQCGCPVIARGGIPCSFVPTWFQNGVWTCARHRVDKNMCPDGTNPPPFEPFECCICITNCTSIKQRYITPCNHSFHKECMKKWAIQNNGRERLECPLCRHHILKHPFKIRTRTTQPSFTNNTLPFLDGQLIRIYEIYDLTTDEQMFIHECIYDRISFGYEESAQLVNERIYSMSSRRSFTTNIEQQAYFNRIHQAEIAIFQTMVDAADAEIENNFGT